MLLVHLDLLLRRLGVGDDLLQELEHTARARRLRVVLRRRGLGGDGLAGSLHELAGLGGVEHLQPLHGLVQDVDGRALIRDRLLEQLVLRLPVLPGLLKARLHLLLLGLQCLEVVSQGVQGVDELLALLVQVLLGVHADLDLILELVDLLLAELHLLVLLLLLHLHLGHHLVHGLDHLREGVQAHANGQGHQGPILVPFADGCQALHGLLGGAVLGGGARGLGCHLQECGALGLAEEVTGIVLRQDLQRLLQGHLLVAADLGACLVRLVLGLAILEHVGQEALIGLHGRLGDVPVLKRLGILVDGVRQLDLLPLLLLRGCRNLSELGRLQILE
mmetsp:Transcript_61049/g.164317  ORF Transcript_61049/g.164317 Transcript_61049/m.164317 type:complete len:333 (+) Transcript_61049:437-1435(+)